MAEALLYGVKEDFEELICKFALMKSYDFDDFIHLWKEMQFYYIFSGRPTLGEMKFFVEHALLLAKDFFLFGSSDFERVGGIYLLYSLYITQPLLKPVEIRIEHGELKELMSFVDSVKEETLDVPFAFMQLHLKNAFHFVYSYFPRTAEKNGRVDIRQQNIVPETVDKKTQRESVLSVLKEANFDGEILREEEKKYNELMKRVSKLNIPGNKVQYKPHDFIQKVLPTLAHPSAPAKVKHKAGRKPRLTKMIEAGIEGSKEEEPEPQPSSSSLPVLCNDDDEDDDDDDSSP